MSAAIETAPTTFTQIDEAYFVPGQQVEVSQEIHREDTTGSSVHAVSHRFIGRIVSVPSLDQSEPQTYHISREGHPTYVVPVWDRDTTPARQDAFRQFVRFGIKSC